MAKIPANDHAQDAKAAQCKASEKQQVTTYLLLFKRVPIISDWHDWLNAWY